MKRFTLLVAALLGLAFSAPAQFQPVRVTGAGGRSPVQVSSPRGIVQHGSHQHGSQQRSPQRAPRQVGRDAHHRGGHWETRSEQVLIPGYWEDQHVPATYGWIYDACGHRHWGVIDRGGCRRVWVPARWETRCHRVWVTC